MTRSMTPAVSGEVAASRLTVVLFAEFLFDGGPLRVWSGIGEITWNGAVWTGAGDLGAVSAVTEAAEVRADNLTFTLSGLPASTIAIALAEPYQGRTCKLHIGFLDGAGAVIADPVTVFVGRMDVMTISEERNKAVLSVVAENRLIDLERPRIRRYTDQDQKSEYPNDRGFEYVAAMQEKKIAWGNR